MREAHPPHLLFVVLVGRVDLLIVPVHVHLHAYAIGLLPLLHTLIVHPPNVLEFEKSKLLLPIVHCMSAIVGIRPRSRHLNVAEIWMGGHGTNNARVVVVKVRECWVWQLRLRLVVVCCSVASEIEWIAKIEEMTASYAEDVWLRPGRLLLLWLLLWSCGRALRSLRYRSCYRSVEENGDVALHRSV